MGNKGKGRSEFALIADLFAPLSKGVAGALGLKDDAALIDVPAHDQLVVAADTLIAGVHFRVGDRPEIVGRKALRVNLSDLAAMGATPIGFLQTLVLNDQISDAYLQEYVTGLAADVDQFEVPLLGGDTTSGNGPFSVTIAALGTVEKGKALRRSGAEAGDMLCVSGTIGDGALGLKCAQGSLPLRELASEYLRGRYERPIPRLEIGKALIGRASACIDVSDGLVADVGHICETSGVAAVIETAKIPLSDAGRAALDQDANLWSTVLSGGDDYELAFTVAQNEVENVKSLSEATGTPISAIGRILPASGDKMAVTVIDESGADAELLNGGYRHR